VARYCDYSSSPSTIVVYEREHYSSSPRFRSFSWKVPSGPSVLTFAETCLSQCIRPRELWSRDNLAGSKRIPSADRNAVMPLICPVRASSFPQSRKSINKGETRCPLFLKNQWQTLRRSSTKRRLRSRHVGEDDRCDCDSTVSLNNPVLVLY